MLPNDTTATLSLSLPRAAESLNCSCCVWTRHTFVDASLAAGRSAALFSATLSPPSFYRSVLGCSDARAVALDSPFPAENLGLYCLPNISTRYRDREASVQAVSDALARLVQARAGNYFAFFPSYAYLRQVHEDFAARYRAFAPLCRKAVWMMPLGLNFWLSLCRTRPKHFWVLA